MLLLVDTRVFAQRKDTFRLSAELREISGIERLNDSTLIAINDGGNSPYIYLLNRLGKVQRRVYVKDAINSDWEALATDDAYLYIGDIGNNRSDRTNLSVYRLTKERLQDQDTVTAERISFAYAEQTDKSQRNFDAEALFLMHDTLWIVAKKRRFFQRYSEVYAVPRTPGNYSLKADSRLKTGMGSWLLKSATGADAHGDTLVICTYSGIQTFTNTNGTYALLGRKHFFLIKQREALSWKGGENYLIANEGNVLLGKMKLISKNKMHAAFK